MPSGGLWVKKKEEEEKKKEKSMQINEQLMNNRLTREGRVVKMRKGI